MPKDDIDRKLAERLAWTFATDVEELRRKLEEEPAEEPEAAPPTNEEVDELVVRVQALLDGQKRERLEEVRSFIRDYADSELLHLFEPEAGTKLAYFLLVHRDGLSEAELVTAGEMAAACMSLESDDTDEYLLALVREGEAAFCEALAELLPPEESPLEGAPDSLGRSLHLALRDDDVPLEGKIFATHLLSCGSWTPDRESLAPLLRSEEGMLRAYALETLHTSGQLDASDLQALLQAQLEDNRFEGDEDERFDADAWNATLRDAIVTLHPPELKELLAALGREPFPNECMDGDWALGTLVEAYPDDAVPLLDEELHRFLSWRRKRAVKALAGLPLKSLLPRLRRMASDPVPDVARLAQEQHLKLTGQPVPIAPVDVLPPGMLAGPASDALLGKLALAAGGDPERRRALRDELATAVREKRGTAEDAALLLGLLCDERLRGDAPDSSDPLNPFDTWMLHLRPLCGPALGRALVALAERFPNAAHDTPLTALGALHRAGLLGEEELGLLRRVALTQALQGSGPSNWWAGSVLSRVGVEVASWQQVFRTAIDEPGVWFLDALTRTETCPELDAAVLKELASAPSFEVACRLAFLGIGRRLPAAIERGLALVARASTQDEVEDAGRVMTALIAHGALTEAVMTRELENPHSPRFLLGWWALNEKLSPAAEVRAQLERALDGLPEAAGHALYGLVMGKAIALDDPRIPRALARFDLEQKSRNVFTLLQAGANADFLAPHILDVLIHGDDDQREGIELALRDHAGAQVLLGQAERVRSKAHVR